MFWVEQVFWDFQPLEWPHMGRNRTPTPILEGKGGFITHKNRKRPDEPTTDRPIGKPPTYLNASEKRVWKQLVVQALPGVLLESDRLMLAVLARLANKLYTGVPMKVGETAQMITLSSKFAMNPADRSKVSVEKPKQSALSLFLAKKQPKAS
jgi:phage terminase small subunit